MRLALGCMLVVCAARGVRGAEPLDELFAGWATSQDKVESLVVEFDLETKGPIFEQGEKSSGTLRLIRTKKGGILASYGIVAKEPMGKAVNRTSGLLNSGKVYLLDHDKRTAMRFEFADDELPLFLEKYFNPLVVLLDRKHAEAKYQLEVVKQDEWYTYLTVKPKQAERYVWFGHNFHEGRVTLMRKDSKAVPKGMPRQLWHSDGLREHLFDIKAWRHNPASGPKLDEFVRPEDRPGWEVMDAPFQREKSPGPPSVCWLGWRQM